MMEGGGSLDIAKTFRLVFEAVKQMRSPYSLCEEAGGVDDITAVKAVALQAIRTIP
jgi:hypothetical protein